MKHSLSCLIYYMIIAVARRFFSSLLTVEYPDKTLSLVFDIYRKIPIISPGFIFVQKAFYWPRLIFGAAYFRRAFCVSKWVRLYNKNNLNTKKTGGILLDISSSLCILSQSLINKDTGAPQEMAGLATHLHYHEPSNFVLVSFLQRGLFHKLCKPGRNGKNAQKYAENLYPVNSNSEKKI